jgi:hypothetical protein
LDLLVLDHLQHLIGQTPRYCMANFNVPNLKKSHITKEQLAEISIVDYAKKLSTKVMSEKPKRNICLLAVAVATGLAIHSQTPLLPTTPPVLLLLSIAETVHDDLITLSVELIRRETGDKDRDAHTSLGISQTLYVVVSNFAHMCFICQEMGKATHPIDKAKIIERQNEHDLRHGERLLIGLRDAKVDRDRLQ